MRAITRRMAALGAAVATLTMLTAGTANARTAGTTNAQVTETVKTQVAGDPWANCPYGAVCIYPQNQDPAVSPSHVFYSYGAHNLSNQYGRHWVLNNQYGGAYAHLCTGYNGAGCNYDIAPQNGVYADLTPINSITLTQG
ncbi:hypothetical protein [Streptomyces sp. NPDC003077]|uniref:hypothetical protein n=1 Tax=Streptomyces sp. NPDC003077 TaxID=3154443 RepID=UPI0033A4EE2D